MTQLHRKAIVRGANDVLTTILITSLGLWVDRALASYFQRTLYMIPLFAIFICSLLGGFGHGLLSTVLASAYLITTLVEFDLQEGGSYIKDIAPFLLFVPFALCTAAVCGINRDSLNRFKVAEEKLNASLLLYRLLFEKSPEPMWVYDTSSLRFLAVNEAAILAYGYTEAEFLGMKVSDLYATGEPQSFRERGQTLYAKHRRKDGSFREVGITSNYFQYHANPSCLEVAKDIESIIKYKDLQESNSFLNTLFDTIPMMMFVKEAKELRFVMMNKCGEELSGLSRDELFGKNDYDLFPKYEADFFVQKDRQVLRSKSLVDIAEEVIHTRNKGTRLLHTRKVVILNSDGKPGFLLGVSEDITELRQIEAERDKSKEQVSRLYIEKGVREQFVSTLSHDLRTPLTAAKASVELLLKFSDSQDRNERLLKNVLKSLNRIDEMIGTLLDANRIQAGQKLPLVSEYCDLISIVQEAAIELRGSIEQTLEVLNPANPVYGTWSKDGLRRVLYNLVTNAAKYGDPKLPISIKTTAKPDRVVLSVHNFGKCIPPHVLNRLFQPFYRSETEVHSGKKGWGLGLILVKGVAEALNGSIEVTSTEREGTTFSLTLPYKEAKEQELSAAG